MARHTNPPRSEEVKLNQIARAGQAQLTPTSGIVSSVEQLANAISAVDNHIGRIAGQFAVKKLDILNELYRRNEPRR